MVESFHLKGIMNIYLSTKRHATIWGGTSLLDMFLDVIRTSISMKEFSKWDYILNLSEADMPLLSLEELEHKIARLNTGNFFKLGKSFRTRPGLETGPPGYRDISSKCTTIVLPRPTTNAR
jgi:hypothetical protein